MKRRKVNPQNCTPMERQRVLIWLQVHAQHPNDVFEIRELNDKTYQLWYYIRHTNGDWLWIDKKAHRRASDAEIVTTEVAFPWPGKVEHWRDALSL